MKPTSRPPSRPKTGDARGSGARGFSGGPGKGTGSRGGAEARGKSAGFKADYKGGKPRSAAGTAEGGKKFYDKKPYAGGKPAGKFGKSFGDKPFGEKKFGDRPAGDKPFRDKPYRERPPGDKPFHDKPYGDRPTGDKPFRDKPFRAKAEGDFGARKPQQGKPYRGKPADALGRDGERKRFDAPRKPRDAYSEGAHKPRAYSDSARKERPAREERVRDERPKQDWPKDGQPRDYDPVPSRYQESRKRETRYKDDWAQDDRRKDGPVAPVLAKTQGTILFGLHAVREAWLNPKRRCHQLWLSRAMAEEFAGTLADAASAKLHRPQPQHAERAALDQLMPGAVHQGIALSCDPLPEIALEDVLRKNPLRLVVLDQVTDPHNVGAILRSAAAFGANAVIMTERNTPGSSGTLAKSASGAMEHVPLVTVVNLARTLETLSEAGFTCVGLAEEGSKIIGALDLSGPTALVLGAEGDGLRRLTREKCDVLARLPTGGPIGALNVSNAAAVALYEMARQKKV